VHLFPANMQVNESNLSEKKTEICYAMDATMWRVREEGQGISRRQEMPSPAARSPQPAPLYRPPATAHPNLGLGQDGRGRPRMRAGWKTEGTRVGFGRLVGNERGGMREETACPVRRRGALEQARRSAYPRIGTPLFPGDFEAFRVGNNPSYGWNSGCYPWNLGQITGLNSMPLWNLSQIPGPNSGI
jgi:hypothetical protein